jgi:hypothetical protein
VSEVVANVEVPATVKIPEFVVLPKLARPVKVGAYEYTATPLFVEPVSSLKRAANCAEVENGVARPRVVVAACVHVFPAPPMRSWLFVTVERPVPPRVPPSVPTVLPRSMLSEEVESAETVLSALRRKMVDELGLVSVKMLEPMVVAPRLVRAPD